MVKRWQSFAGACGIGLLSVLAYGSELDEANRLFVFGKYGPAIEIYQKVTSRENQKESEEALFGIGRAYQMLGRWKLAKERFEKLFRDHPDSELAAGARIQIGQCEVKLGSPQKALAIFQEIERTHLGEEAAIEATYNLANLNVGFLGDDVRNAQSAIAGYNRVLDSERGKRYAIQSHFGLGQCYMMLGQYPRAIDAFRTTIEEGPDTIWAGYARDQILNAMKVLDRTASFKRLQEAERFWLDFQRRAFNHVQLEVPLAWWVSTRRPVLRVRAVAFRTESPEAGSGAQKVFYSKPTIYYGRYIFRSDGGTVDRLRRTLRSVECVGNVKCTDSAVPPVLTVTSGALKLDLGKNRAVFSRDVKYEKRGAPEPVQLVVGELHLLLDSGDVEIPAK